MQSTWGRGCQLTRPSVLQPPKLSSRCPLTNWIRELIWLEKKKKSLNTLQKATCFSFQPESLLPSGWLHSCTNSCASTAAGPIGGKGCVGWCGEHHQWNGERESLPAWAPSGTSLLRGPLGVAALPSHPAGECLSVLPSSHTQRARSNRHSSILASLEGAGCSIPGKAGSLVVVCSPVLLSTCSRAALEDRLRERLMLIPGDSQE